MAATAASVKLSPEVVRKVLASIERELEILEQRTAFQAGVPHKRTISFALPHKDRAEADRIRGEVRKHVDELRAKLGDRKPSDALAEQADWRVVTAAWQRALPLIEDTRQKGPWEA